MRTAWTVSATSCARMMCAPDRQRPESRRPATRANVHLQLRAEKFPDERFPRNAQQQRPPQLCKTAQAAQAMQIVLQPSCRSRCRDPAPLAPVATPASVQFFQPLVEKFADLADDVSVSADFSASSAACPARACKRSRRGIRRRLSTLHRLLRLAATSLTMLAPAASAARATAGFIVSIEIKTRSAGGPPASFGFGSRGRAARAPIVPPSFR